MTPLPSPRCQDCGSRLRRSLILLAIDRCFPCRVFARCAIPWRPPVRQHAWSSERISIAIKTWVTIHDRVPLSQDFVIGTREGTLPSQRTVFRYFSSMDALYMTIAKGQYLEMYRERVYQLRHKIGQYRKGWALQTILDSIETWHRTEGEGVRVPMTRDFLTCSHLPSVSIIFQHIGTLPVLYARYANGAYLSQYHAQRLAAYRANRERLQSQKQPHKGNGHESACPE